MDMQFVEKQPYEWLHAQLCEMLVSIPRFCRNAAVDKFMATHFEWLPLQLSHRQLDGASKHRVLSHVDVLLRAKSMQDADKHLCEQILSGALDGDAVAQAMISGLLHKAQASQAGKKRLGSLKRLSRRLDLRWPLALSRKP